MSGPPGRVIAVALTAVLAALATSAWTGLIPAVPLAVALGGASAVLSGWPRSRSWLAGVALLASAVSLATTSARFLTSYRFPPTAALLGLVEVAALALVLVLAVRWLPLRPLVPAGVLVAAAVGTWILRIVPESTPLGLLGALSSWSPVPVVAALAGGYGRRADRRRRLAVQEARRAQRLDLARDLHDFVAHDVTGIVVQAQAAQLVGAEDPQAALDALRRIEEAGQQALASMDEALQVLRTEPDGAVPDDDGAVGRGGLAELPQLLARFADSGGPAVDAQVDRRLVEGLPARVSAVAYRIVVEGLTNVRRHATHAREVSVRIDDGGAGDALTVSIVNDLPQGGEVLAARDPGVGGAGLAELAQLVRDQGGELTAGPERGNWRLTARLPLPGPRPSA
ncbi:sensor histidine kinase [Geodermatophilus maliterrae]|uniref:histidine kinase n=1 Tax=Geodermatophilus maliterrae TaxID=3162531 RepID=A0ABV3XG71_9ACTN